MGPIEYPSGHQIMSPWLKVIGVTPKNIPKRRGVCTCYPGLWANFAHRHGEISACFLVNTINIGGFFDAMLDNRSVYKMIGPMTNWYLEYLPFFVCCCLGRNFAKTKTIQAECCTDVYWLYTYLILFSLEWIIDWYLTYLTPPCLQWICLFRYLKSICIHLFFDIFHSYYVHPPGQQTQSEHLKSIIFWSPKASGWRKRRCWHPQKMVILILVRSIL